MTRAPARTSKPEVQSPDDPRSDPTTVGLAHGPAVLKQLLVVWQQLNHSIDRIL